VRKLIFFLLLSAWNVLPAQEYYHRSLLLMGSGFGITVVANDSVTGEGFIDRAIYEIQRIERLISSWDPKSQTTAINSNAGISPVKVDQELFDLMKRSIAISKVTDGAFDISYASMDRIWRFDGSMLEMPSKEMIQNSIRYVGFDKIIFNDEKGTVYLPEKGMKIGFGGIGKGYAADRAKQLLTNEGVRSGIVNASGDMNTWGKKLNGDDWKIAITNPLNKEKSFGVISLSNGAIVTSGDYEKFVNFNGERYSHIIHPKTGMPCKGIISVSVLAPKAELADALATSIFVMGIEVGINRINQMPNIECIIIDEFGGIHQSENIEIQSL